MSEGSYREAGERLLVRNCMIGLGYWLQMENTFRLDSRKEFFAMTVVRY